MSNTLPSAVPDRLSFGQQAETYASHRPAYPQAVFDAIADYAQAPLQHAFELGAGTGLASLPLLHRLPVTLDAYEPDAALTAIWSRQMMGAQLPARVFVTDFDQAEPARAHYDLGLAATVMHWLTPATALAKVRRWLSPGGSWAMWWTVFGDPAEPDAFMQASETLYRHIAPPRTLPHALDEDARVRDLSKAGLNNIECHSFRWHCEQTTEQVIGLARTFSDVARLPSAQRERFLLQLATLVNEHFGGRVRRNFVTPLYLATAP